MSQAISPSSKRSYGLARVCRVWGVSRASLYRRRRAENPLRVVGKRGPKTQYSDEDLLELIREDLETTEWVGEGHRKVWARLRALKGVRTSRPRVLRLERRSVLVPNDTKVTAPEDTQRVERRAHIRQAIERVEMLGLRSERQRREGAGRLRAARFALNSRDPDESVRALKELLELHRGEPPKRAGRPPTVDLHAARRFYLETCRTEGKRHARKATVGKFGGSLQYHQREGVFTPDPLAPTRTRRNNKG